MISPPQRVLRRLRGQRRPALAVLLLLFLLDALVLLHRRRPTSRAIPKPAGHDDNTTVFIASVHRNTAKILPAWTAAALALVDYLGPERVYFSALESGSQDDTKERLTALKEQLDARRVPNTISLGMTVWDQLDEMWARPDPAGPRQPGWIWNEEDGLYDLRRITYLARERNKALEPMRELERRGVSFDRLLWINDVVFSVEDFVTLLRTRSGDYAAACAMDFKYSSTYYDTFALRDRQGHKTVSNYWPWFLSPSSRDAALRSEPMRVESCWNGMVVFDAAPFYGAQPLGFRAIPDSLADLHLEASECCLIHADNPLANKPDKGVWLNPNVRVGYSMSTYRAVQGIQGATFPGPVTTVVGAWANRWLRWRATLQQRLETATVLKRVRQWREATPHGEPLRSEPGISCLINEKQIMWMNGWRHL